MVCLPVEIRALDCGCSGQLDWFVHAQFYIPVEVNSIYWVFSFLTCVALIKYSNGHFLTFKSFYLLFF